MNKEFILPEKLRYFCEAFLFNIRYRLAINYLPFSRLVKNLTQPTQFQASENSYEVERVKWALRNVTRYFPYLSNCLSTAAAGMSMLKKRGIISEIYLGVQRTDKLRAHAWLKSSGKFICGGRNHQRFSIVSVIRSEEVVTQFPKQITTAKGMIMIEDFED